MNGEEILANFHEEVAKANREMLENALFLGDGYSRHRFEEEACMMPNLLELSLPTTSPPIPSPMISHSSEFLFGSPCTPQPSPDIQGSLRFKLEEEGNESFLPRSEIRMNEISMQEDCYSFSMFDVNLQFSELQGRYLVMEQSGEGTFSTVYKAISLVQGNAIVALKRISPKCCPERILREMQLFRMLGGKGHVPPLLDVIRFRDQITLVLPFVEHLKFKDFMPQMKLVDVRHYMRCLFESLAYIHSWHIIHRDLKPGNFLYNPITRTCALVDFGLAQVEVPKPVLQTNPTPSLKRKRSEITADASKLTYIPSLRPRSTRISKPLIESDPQLEMKTLHASRGGTRGFRAPEVLLKCQYQTVAIDVWSAGVMLLSILSTRYPFFSAPDDLSSLAEVASIVGTKKVRDIGKLLNRSIHFPFEAPTQSLKQLCNRLSNRDYQMPDEAFDLLERCLDLNPDTRITAQEALNHPFLAK